MKSEHGTFFLRNGATMTGLDDIIFAAVAGYPNRDVYADINREGNSYSFQLLQSPPSSSISGSTSSADHVGYLFSKRVKSMFDYDFEWRLQPSVSDLRSMYESGDMIRAFVATNGVGWAFRLFDFQDVSLAELKWLESGFIRIMRSPQDVEAFLDCLPRRLALIMLQRNERMVRFLVEESRTIGARIDRPQGYYGAVSSDPLARLLSMATSVIIAGEASLAESRPQSDEVFERHIVEALNSIKQGNPKSAFAEALKFSFPSVSALAGLASQDDKARKIVEINSRLHELRLPAVPESKKLEALVDFLEKTLECAYSFLVESRRRLRARHKQEAVLDRSPAISEEPDSWRQLVLIEGEVFDGVKEFMAEAIRSHPNIVIGQIRRSAELQNRYSIANLRVLPCDAMIEYYAAAGSRDYSVGASSGGLLVGKALSRVCCSEHEMLVSLHPDTKILNGMLRSGYSFNAVAVTNGEKCVFRLHDGSNNTLVSVYKA